MGQLLRALALAGAFGATSAAADDLTVVELFSSQGCSSCPPADAMLHDLAKRDDVIALALHVDYWDYIGWKDTFADPAYTLRQHGYAHANDATTVYTPQMVIGGVDFVVGTRPMVVADLIRDHGAIPNPVEVTLTVSGGQVLIRAEAVGRTRGTLAVQVVSFDPYETVAIARGENAGRELAYANVVTNWTALGDWNGRGVYEASVPRGTGGIAVLVQENGFGRILGAAQIK